MRASDMQNVNRSGSDLKQHSVAAQNKLPNFNGYEVRLWRKRTTKRGDSE